MKVVLFAFFLLSILPKDVFAQWKTQTVKLHSGWNAIFLEVQPEMSACEKMFSGLPVESVWAWNRKFRTIQFVQNTSDMLPEQPEWLTWFPKGHPKEFLNNMFLLNGGKAYLIKMKDDVGEVELKIKGKVVVRKPEWYPDSFNLIGMNINADSPPTFAEYFSGSDAHKGQPVYKLNSDGEWVEVKNLANEKIEFGKAYWVKCKGASKYPGPINVSVLGGTSVEFGKNLCVNEITVENLSSSEKTFSFKIKSSELPPASEKTNAGDVPLLYWKTDFQKQHFLWENLPSKITKKLAPGKKWTVRLMVKRNDMKQMNEGALFQNIVEIDNGAGAKISLPLTAEQAATSDYPGGAKPFPRDGLWVGYAVLNKVSMAHGTSVPQPTSSPMSFRIILHQNSNGVVRLLQKATVMMKRTDTTNLVVITNDKLIPQFLSGELSENSVEGQRFSSIAFGMRSPVDMTYSKDEGKLTGDVFIGYDDPLSPFKHLYHPDLNNLKDYETKLPEGVESFDVTRKIKMIFKAEPVEGASVTSWGDTVVGGEYSEAIDGLYHKTLNVSGEFVLNQVTDAADLYTGQ